ncbi:response regulator [Blastopirellula marina]|uniref:Sigma-54 dependent transcriptional regulator/response regulator n=1 Tax=Blastopirellula marina DSM 3645 TaxID=314230 RepID=A3ZTL8_9BACT|nr:response regulator [Blastopirellula marina]EAQ80284.1 sigma-54 dependent transcriptional regulator/response regulator [Blastopirellula marina DSM 3645]
MNKKVLHVDDDPQILRLVGRQLSSAGFEMISLDQPEKAMKTLLDSSIRVCILDIEMPRINGLDLLQDIKQYDGGIQVVMLTGLVTLSTVLDSMRYGAESCLFKPVVEFDPLVEVLEAAFEKQLRWWNALHELKQRQLT